jgi:hypothetical protein
VSAGSFVEVIVLVFQSCELYRLLDMPQEVWESFAILLAFKVGKGNTITSTKKHSWFISLIAATYFFFRLGSLYMDETTLVSFVSTYFQLNTGVSANVHRTTVAVLSRVRRRHHP